MDLVKCSAKAGDIDDNSDENDEDIEEKSDVSKNDEDHTFISEPADAWIASIVDNEQSDIGVIAICIHSNEVRLQLIPKDVTRQQLADYLGMLQVPKEYSYFVFLF